MKNFSRRNFLSMATKLLAGTAVLGVAPNLAEARINPRDIGRLEETPLTNITGNILPFDMPKISTAKTLSELKIGTQKLKFVESMESRKFTNAIVVHHAGMTRNEDMSLKDIHRLHLGNGWAGVGYHFIVHKNGVIEHARPLEKIGAHAYKHNRYTVGICMTGNFDIGVPTPEQALATEELVAALCMHYDIVPDRKTVWGHMDLCATSCPGKNFYPRLPELIGNVDRALRKI